MRNIYCSKMTLVSHLILLVRNIWLMIAILDIELGTLYGSRYLCCKLTAKNCIVRMDCSIKQIRIDPSIHHTSMIKLEKQLGVIGKAILLSEVTQGLSDRMKGSSLRSYARFFKRFQLWTQNLNSSHSYFGFTVSAFLSFTGWYKYNRFPSKSHKTNKSQTPDIRNENNRTFSIGRSNKRTQVRRFIFWYTQVCF